ncbi:MAG TPA: Fic family protein, partial [bacterium]|nr:Fic family protein [bacterium]
MFEPKYHISDKLLNNIKQISVVMADVNNRSFSDVVLADFEQRANSLSAHASTSIEGNPLPLTDVKRLIKLRPENIRDTEREVLNYNEALESINEKTLSGRVIMTIKFICETQKLVTKGLIEKFRCGKLRNEPVFVNDPRVGKPVYLPPDHQDVPQLMNELLDFVKTKRGLLDPLILAGLFHKQFVIIHPFIDGNGRTTRLVTKALLADLGLNTFRLFSFENFYHRNVSRYFKTVGVLGNYYKIINQIDFTEWLEYFTDGILDELLRVKKELGESGATPDTVLQSHHKKILSVIEK